MSQNCRIAPERTQDQRRSAAGQDACPTPFTVETLRNTEYMALCDDTQDVVFLVGQPAEVTRHTRVPLVVSAVVFDPHLF